MRSRPRRAAPALALALALAAAPASAREGDRSQPADVEADRVEIDRDTGISHYYGNVVFTQGTLRLSGDRVDLRAPGGVMEHATAVGAPARVRQETDAGEVVRAHARTIEYDAVEGLVTLTGDAELLRTGERFAAGRIVYRQDSGRLEAGRGDDDQRVRIRIEPHERDGGGAEDDEGGAGPGQ